jgi:FixJ family two-component response regulator
MTKTENQENDPSRESRFVLEHVDRRGRVSRLPLRHDTQKLLAVTMLNPRQERDSSDQLSSYGLGEAVKSLTARQWQVFDLLISGLSSKQIAHELSISPRTVDIHRAQLKQKMGVRNTASLVRVAFLAA